MMPRQSGSRLNGKQVNTTNSGCSRITEEILRVGLNSDATIATSNGKYRGHRIPISTIMITIIIITSKI